MQVLHGSLVALVTPLLENGDVDYESLSNLLDWHIDNGTDGIVSVGTTGESATLNVKEHIDVYGAYNDQRLTGDHETQSINEFSYGVSDRGASIRIPIMTVEKGWKGWLEDRRPASNGDPYKIAARIIKTVKSAKI